MFIFKPFPKSDKIPVVSCNSKSWIFGLTKDLDKVAWQKYHKVPSFAFFEVIDYYVVELSKRKIVIDFRDPNGIKLANSMCKYLEDRVKLINQISQFLGFTFEPREGIDNETWIEFHNRICQQKIGKYRRDILKNYGLTEEEVRAKRKKK